MSSIIHMETDEVKRVISLIRQIQENMNEQVNNAAMVASNLEWIGPDRDHFLENFQSWKQISSSRLVDFQNLGDRLAAERDQWLQADSDGSNRMKALIGDISKGSELTGFWWWLRHLGEQKKQQYSISDAWQRMMDTKSGRKLIELAKKLGIKFVLPSGETIGEGDYVVNITVEDLEDGAAGVASPGSIRIDQEIMDEEYATPDYLAQVLAHEIQHQVDRKQGLLPDENHTDTILENLNNGNQDSAEQMLKDAIQKRAESEIRAHNRGFEVDRTWTENEGIVNGDNKYSKDEITYIVENRNYESVYEDQYNSAFPGYRVDVWVDDAGQIQCDIVSLIEARDVYHA